MEDDIYDLDDKQERKMAVVVSLIAFMVAAYLGIEIYSKDIVPVDAGGEPTVFSSKYDAISTGFQKN